VLRNRHWAKKLRLKKHLPRIASTIGVNPRVSADAFVDALKAWQQSQGLPPNGVLNPQTVDAMKNGGGAPGATPPPEQAPCQCPACQGGAADAPPEPAAAAPDAAEPDAPATDAPQEELWDWWKGWVTGGSSPTPAAPATPTPATSTTVNRSSAAYIKWVQAGLNKVLGLKLAVDGINGSMTRAAVRDFQSRQGLPADGNMNLATEQALTRAGAGNPPAATAPSSSTTGVNTPLPASGPGFYAKPESWPDRQYGLSQTIAAVQAIGKAWLAKHPSGPRFGITDISFKGGGTMSPHASHTKGVDVDIRPMRNDGVESGTNYKDSSYSKTLTQDLVDTIRASSPMSIRTILFNGAGIKGVSPYTGHDDHMHVSFNVPSGGSGELPDAFTFETGKAPGPPRLLKSETDPPDASCYLDIKLGSEGGLKPMTGVFFPKGFQKKSEIDVIVYFHGHRIERKIVKESIDAYWNKKYAPYFPLREELNAAGKNAILIAPTLGPRSQPGLLLRKGGLDKYLGQVLAGLRAHGPLKGMEVSIGKIVLAAHSGGGTAMRYTALYGGKHSTKIRECWGFDCLYDGSAASNWSSFAKAHPDAKLYFYWHDTKTLPQVRALEKAKLANVTVKKSDKGHMYVPIRYFKERVLGF
jgi:peptidoglycan hydrolase-like protein with peptidoglycan-binding domain